MHIPSKKRPLTFEQMEPRQMFAGDIPQSTDLLATLRNDTYTDVADALIDIVADAERARLADLLAGNNAELQRIASDLNIARAKQAAWDAQTPYQRSAYHAADILGSRSLNDREEYLVASHGKIMGLLYDIAGRAIQHEASGDKRGFDAAMGSLESVIKLVNTDGFRGLFGQLELPFPTDAADFLADARTQMQTGVALNDAAQALGTQMQTREAEHANLTAALDNPVTDLRPGAQAVDGHTPEELAALDMLFEHELSVDLGLDVSLNQFRDQISERMNQTSSGVSFNLSNDEFQALAEDVSKAMTTFGHNHEATRDEIIHILNDSPITRAVGDLEESLRIQSAKKMAEDIARQLIEEAERKNKAPYAHMYVDVGNIPGTYDVLFRIRYRSPDDKSIIKIGGNDYLINEHPGGTADSELQVRLGYENRMPNGEFPVHLVDYDTHKILETVYIYADPLAAQISVLTRQADWDHIEQGRTVEHPIEPDMSIIKTSVNNVLLAVQSPYDQTVVGFRNGGRFAMQELQHENGTNLGVGFITFDATKPTGEYQLEMRDRTNGRILDTVIMHWDAENKTLSPADAADMFASNRRAAEDALQQHIDEFDGILSLDDAQLNDANIRFIQQTRLYEETAKLEAPYNFATIDLKERIYALHPEYRPENRDAAIQQYAASRPTYSYSSSKSSFNTGMRDYFDRKEDRFSTYLLAMRTLMEKAADIIIQIRKGGDEEQLIKDFDRMIRNEWTGHTNNGRRIEELRELGITIPRTDYIIEAAKMVVDRMWTEMLRYESDVIAYQQYLERLAEGPNPMRVNADGELVAISEFNPNDVPKKMDRHQLSLASKIKTALDTSNDPRILAYNDTIKSTIALKTAQNIPPDATEEEIVQTIEVVMHDVEDETLIDGINGIKYTVRSGDTLSDIAARYGVSDWHDIYQHPMNASLRTPERTADSAHMYWLITGEEIWIPTTSVPESSETAEETESNAFSWIENDLYNLDNESSETLPQRIQNIMQDPQMFQDLIGAAVGDSMSQLNLTAISVNALLGKIHDLLDQAYDVMQAEIDNANDRIQHEYLTEHDRELLEGRIIYARAFGLAIEGIKFYMPTSFIELAAGVLTAEAGTALVKVMKAHGLLSGMAKWYTTKTGRNVAEQVVDSPAVRESIERIENIIDYLSLKAKVTLTVEEKVNLDHFIFGQINAKGEAVGGHAYAGIRNGTIQVVDGTQKYNAQGIMEAKIKIWDPVKNIFVPKEKVSTFFPKDWTKDDIALAVNEALGNKLRNESGAWSGIGNGIRIRLNFKNGTLESFYPIF